jgi:hypothetical protein
MKTIVFTRKSMHPRMQNPPPALRRILIRKITKGAVEKGRARKIGNDLSYY